MGAKPILTIKAFQEIIQDTPMQESLICDIVFWSDGDVYVSPQGQSMQGFKINPTFKEVWGLIKDAKLIILSGDIITAYLLNDEKGLAKKSVWLTIQKYREALKREETL